MNILNLNGISADDVKYNIEFQRASGFDDAAIREQYNQTLETLKPITRVPVDAGKKIKEYNEKGGITPYEYAKREFEFDGTYDNIKAPVQTERGKAVDERIKRDLEKKAERNKRVNEGTANFFERAGAALDRWGVASTEVQTNSQISAPEEVGARAVQEYEKNRDKTKKIDFAEALANGYMSGAWTPFVGGYVSEFDKSQATKTREKILKGEPITQAELDFLNRQLDRQNEENIRGYTTGGAIAHDFLNSLIRFGSEMAVGGWMFKALGLPKVGAAIGGGITKGLEAANVGEKAAKTAGNVGKIITNASLFGALNTVSPTTYSDTYENYQQRRFDKAFRFTDSGKVYFKEIDEKPATSFMKSLMQTYLMFTTESLGELVGMPVKYITGAASKKLISPMGKYLASNKNLKKLMENSIPVLSKAYEKLNDLPVKGKSLDWLKSKVKYDGLLEEIGEEVLEDILNITLETGDEKRSLENYAKAIFKSPDEWAVLVGAVALQGGVLSVASHVLGNYMEKNGATDEEIAETIENLKEEGVQEQVLKLAESGELQLDNYNSKEKQRERAVNSLAERFGKNLKNKDYSKNAADILVSMAEHISELSPETSVEDIIQNEAPEIVREDGKTQEETKTRSIDNRLRELEQEFENISEENYDAEKYDALEAEYNELVELQQQGETYYQGANLAGAEAGEYADAAKEYKEKGTESKYFKKWFGKSKIVDENGNPRLVYHGSLWNFDTFGKSAEFDFSFNPRFAHDYASSKSFEQGLDREPVLYDVYLKVENPFDFRDEKQVDEFIEKIKNKDVRIFGTPTSGETLKNDIMGFNYENTVKRQEDFDKAEIGMAYSRDNENVEEHISSVARDKIVFKNKDYFVAAQELREPEYSYFSSREDRYQIRNKKEVYAELEKIAKDIDFKDTHKQKVIIQTEKVRAERAWDKDGKFYIKEDVQPYELEVTLLKIDNPKVAKKAGGYDNWFQLESMTIDGESFVEYIQNNGYDGYYKQEKGKLNISVFKPEQIKSVENKGTFDANNPNIYYQRKQVENPDQLKLNFDAIVEQQSEQLKLIFEPVSSTEQNVQKEIKETYTEADIKQEKIDEIRNNNQGEIVDTGDSLLGNLKKDKKQYTWDELEGMNDLLRKKYLSKSYIYQLPSAEELRKENLSDRTIAFVYLIYSKINARPAKGYDETKEHQKIYFDGVHEVMQKTLDFAKKNNDLIANYSKTSARNSELFDMVYPDYNNKKPYNVFTAYPDLNKKAIIVGGNKLVSALQLGYSTESDITKALILVDKEKGTKTKTENNLEGWEKKFEVAETYRGWCIADRKSGMIISNRDLPSKEIAEQIAKQMYEYLQKQNSSFTVNYKDLRNYIPRRENNQNVKPEALIEVFGFRGINFGNWTKQSERQDFLNLAYDSLHDLAELLKLPPKALSLDGKLGLAFGAQGRSKAAGHFIPEYNEINLTRKSGAGSLAHEWWHALDFYFGDLSLNKDFSGRSALGAKEQGELRPEIFNALKNLEEQIKYAPLTEKELAEKSTAIEQGAKRNLEYWANDIKKSFAKSKNADKIVKFVDKIVKNAETIDTKNDEELRHEYYELLDERRRTWENLGKLSNLEYQCRKLQQVKELAAASKKYSKYFENAKLLNTYEKGMGASYWTSNTELGARAFASYILDKMTKQKFDNGFLVRDEKGEISFNLEVISKKIEAKEKGEEYKGEESSIIEWYPAEPDERKRIFAAFDDLFNSIQYKQTDRGYKLYQTNAQNNNQNLPYNMQDLLKKYGYGSDVYFKNKIEAIPENDKNKIEKFKDIVDEVIDRIKNNKSLFGIDTINLGFTPVKLQEAGLKNIKIKMDAEVIKKARSQKNEGHNLDIDVIKSIPELLHNPIAVMKSISKGHEKDSVVVITEAKDNEGYNVIVPIRLSVNENENQKGYKEYLINEIMSIHGRSNIEYVFSETLEQKGILKIDKNKMQDLHKFTTRLQNVAVASPTTNSIADNAENFNPNVNKHEDIKYTQDDYQENLFFDNKKAEMLRNVKGAYIPAEKVIELYKNADESTFLHEMAHWYLDMLTRYSEGNEALTEELQAVRDWLKNDGGEWTREQHEKFARGFEAYIRSGYAKNNKLKKVFEYFKNFLLSIYDSLKKLDIDEAEMPQIVNLFDRLLSTEKERIKSTVFDKIAEIDNKIQTIKDNEAKEFAELDEIYKNNISYLNRKSDKKRSVQEYLDLAETMTGRETKEVKEYKQRYKDATLSILSVYSGKPKSWVANSNNWEELQNIIGNGSDRITSSDGFLPEWGEFYTDTGVSYETDEVGGDDELARQAFEVLSEGQYNKTLDENYQFDDINKFSAKVDYLAAKVKTLKGEEKNAAIEALYSLFNEMPSMPDEVSASILEKIDGVAQEAEEQQKEDFNRKVIPSIPVMQQLQIYVTQKLNDLKIYNPETRYKMRLNKSHRLYRYIKDVKSVNSAKKQIRRINEFVIDDMRNNQRSLLHKEIQKQIKVNSKVVKVGTMSKGKFDWKTNTVFAELVQMNKLTREQAEKEFGSLIQIQDAVKGEDRDSYDENETSEFNKSNSFQENLKREFLQYRSMRLQNLDVTHTIQLLQDILELKEKGRQAKSEEDFINKTQRWNTKNDLLDVLEITKQSGAAFGARWIAGVGKGISLNGGTLANWESLLNSIFNKDTAQKYSLLGLEAKSEVYARKHMLEFYKRASEIYGFNQASSWDRFLDYDYMQPLIKLMQEYNNEKYIYKQRVFSINSPNGYAESDIEISRAQMITMFAWSLNEQLEQRLMTQFGVNSIMEMFEERLSEQDRQLAWALIDTCEGMREDINEVFIRTTGLSLPKVENYFPSKAERVQSDIDMFHDNFVKSSNPSFIKERKICNRIPMKPLAPLEILIPHINKTAKYVVMSEHVNFLNQIFKDTAIKTKMQEIWGSKDGADIYQTLINKLAACTFTNYSKGTNLVAGALDTLSRNYITSSIGFSPKVAIGQLLSVINYAENMPAGVWAKGFTETIMHPVENFKYMLDNCEYLQARLAGNSQNEVIAILTSEKDKFRTLRNFMTSNVKWGDMIAITLGGKPYVDYLMQQGMTKEEAFDKFVEDTMRAQQAGTISSISEWQAAQARNCLTRMFFAFRNTDMQYERKFVDTLVQTKKGDIAKKEAIKKLFIYKIFNPFMFTSFLQNLSIVALISAAFRGDDPDDTIGGFLKNAIEAVMLGGMTAYGFAGFIARGFMESLIALHDKEFKHFETDVPIMTDFDRQVQKFLKGDLSFADYVDALALGTEVGLGLPARKVVNTVEGAGNVLQGNVGVGLTRMMGWGKYTSTKAWTGEAPEKKKKRRRK